MGGIQMNDGAECLDKNGKVIPGLMVAGEAMGGVHGRNRLGGNSLLDCVVFGRVAGATATRDLLNFALNTLEKGGSLQQAQHSAKGNSMAAAAAGGAGVVLSAEEVARHNTAQDCWVILGGKVYDVTDFLDD